MNHAFLFKQSNISELAHGSINYQKYSFYLLRWYSLHNRHGTIEA